MRYTNSSQSTLWRSCQRQNAVRSTFWRIWCQERRNVSQFMCVSPLLVVLQFSNRTKLSTYMFLATKGWPSKRSCQRVLNIMMFETICQTIEISDVCPDNGSSMWSTHCKGTSSDSGSPRRYWCETTTSHKSETWWSNLILRSLRHSRTPSTSAVSTWKILMWHSYRNSFASSM